MKFFFMKFFLCVFSEGNLLSTGWSKCQDYEKKMFTLQQFVCIWSIIKYIITSWKLAN